MSGGASRIEENSERKGEEERRAGMRAGQHGAARLRCGRGQGARRARAPTTSCIVHTWPDGSVRVYVNSVVVLRMTAERNTRVSTL